MKWKMKKKYIHEYVLLTNQQNIEKIKLFSRFFFSSINCAKWVVNATNISEKLFLIKLIFFSVYVFIHSFYTSIKTRKYILHVYDIHKQMKRM